MVLLTAFALLLQRYSGQDDLVIGTDVAGRTRQEIEDVVGFFVNMLPLRVQIGGKKTGRQLLEQVREILLAAYAHQDLPFEKLVEVLQPERTLSYHPLFQVKLVLQNTPQSDLSFPDVSIQHIKVENTTARFDLLLNITDSSPALHGHLEYNTDLFTSSTAIYLLEMFEYILLQLVNTLDQKVDEYNKVLSDFEQQRREHKAQQVHEASRQKMQSIKRKRVF
jgi:non-ribosomal peptide synthetase component F